MNKILWLDTETSGTDPVKNGIIQIAGLIEINGYIEEGFEIFNNCNNKQIENKALEINNFTVDKIKTFDSPLQSYIKLINIFSKHINKFDKNDKFIIAGQNIKFDIDFLLNFFKENNDNYFFSWIQSGAYIDTFYLITILQHLKIMPILENRKNETITNHFNNSIKIPHNAIEDIKATRYNYYRMTELLEV